MGAGLAILHGPFSAPGLLPHVGANVIPILQMSKLRQKCTKTRAPRESLLFIPDA